ASSHDEMSVEDDGILPRTAKRVARIREVTPPPRIRIGRNGRCGKQQKDAAGELESCQGHGSSGGCREGAKGGRVRVRRACCKWACGGVDARLERFLHQLGLLKVPNQ